MGVFISRSEDSEIYRDAYEEAQRIIRISDEIRISLEKVAKTPNGDKAAQVIESSEESSEDSTTKITSSKLAQKHKMKTPEFLDNLISLGYLSLLDGKQKLTEKGKEVGGEFKYSPRFGPYFIWPEDMVIK